MTTSFTNDAGTGTVTADGFIGPQSGGAVSATTLDASGVSTLSGGLTTTGARVGTISVVAAAGATQGTATAIGATQSIVVITVTASTEGVKLPTAATGKQVIIIADTAVGAKVYGGAAGQTIGTATTATTAYALVKNTVTTFFATSATKWRILKGG